jgi:butyrate response factor 1
MLYTIERSPSSTQLYLPEHVLPPTQFNTQKFSPPPPQFIQPPSPSPLTPLQKQQQQLYYDLNFHPHNHHMVVSSPSNSGSNSAALMHRMPPQQQQVIEQGYFISPKASTNYSPMLASYDDNNSSDDNVSSTSSDDVVSTPRSRRQSGANKKQFQHQQHQHQQQQQQQQQQTTIVGNEGPYGVFMNRSGVILLDGNQFDDIVVQHTNTTDNNVQYQTSTRDRYKTELCRSWEETNFCRYGDKCQFAHGRHEIREVTRHHKYKSELCNNYHYEGTCMYGIRCCFIHKVSPDDLGRAMSQNIDVVPMKRFRRLKIFHQICNAMDYAINYGHSSSNNNSNNYSGRVFNGMNFPDSPQHYSPQLNYTTHVMPSDQSQYHHQLQPSSPSNYLLY